MKKILIIILLLNSVIFSQTFSSTHAGLVYDSLASDLINGYIAQFHRIDTLASAGTNTWYTVQFDTMITSETTTGYTWGDDSTYFIVSFNGDTRVQGCGHWEWTGGGGSGGVYIRVMVNSVEARCLQANAVRTNQTSDNGIIPFIGTIDHSVGDTIRVQYKVSSTDMDFIGQSAFDNPVALSVNFEKINNND